MRQSQGISASDQINNLDRTAPQPDGSDAPGRWKALKVFAWLSLIANVLIIATGGAVRLTGSGLGCPTWPMCTPGSLVPTEELSWHSLIEFGNRTMTGVLGILGVIVLLLLWRWRNHRRDLYVLSIIVIVGIIAQAVVGGITVWTGLNPFIVGFHYLATLALVAITTVFMIRFYSSLGRRVKAVHPLFLVLTHVTTLFLAITLVIGVLTTGAGPHSGDANVRRTGFDASLLAHLHSWPGYILLSLVLILTIWAMSKNLRPKTQFLCLLIVLIVQIFIGVYQARNGLPALSVGVHMLLAAVSTAFMVWAVMNLKQPVSDEPQP
ncbi:MAG: COX15/CtaA family protein [Canibacter sp.]